MIYIIIIYYAFKAKINSCYFDKSSLQNRCKITAIISYMQIFFLRYCIKVRVGTIILLDNIFGINGVHVQSVTPQLNRALLKYLIYIIKSCERSVLYHSYRINMIARAR